jgi:rhomboid protease GluP
MTEDDSTPRSLELPAGEPAVAHAEEFRPLDSREEDEEDIPVIDDDMLHQERVDLEAGMSVFPRVTVVLILACIAVFVRQLMIGGLDNLGRVIATGATHRDEVFKGAVWRLISGGFMHASGDHLAGNMFMLFILGMACEHAFGWQAFLFLYVSACITGAIVTLVPGVPTVGASGAIFGLAGAIISMMYVNRERIELRDHRVGFVLAIWSIYTLVLGFLSPIVSNSCHLGGLLGGLILGALLPPAILTDRTELARRPTSRLQSSLALTALIASAVFFVPCLR